MCHPSANMRRGSIVAMVNAVAIEANKGIRVSPNPLSAPSATVISKKKGADRQRVDRYVKACGYISDVAGIPIIAKHSGPLKLRKSNTDNPAATPSCRDVDVTSLASSFDEADATKVVVAVFVAKNP
mmetsp:Transcript_18774/g.28294  ORF Transcript_18774/g.28294 Transcript_18774/m.28294 type:complete len:127 (-) Transcript_18774:411-791(-)